MYNWLEFYDWVLGPDGPKPPPDEEILNDDEALDEYIERWRRNLEKGSKGKKGI